METFDPKPKLTEWHGKEIPVKLQTERKTTNAFGSPSYTATSGMPMPAARDRRCTVSSSHCSPACWVLIAS